YDLDSDDYERTSLIDAERDGDVADDHLSRAEPAQSLAASDDAVYTGGHFTLGIRHAKNGELQQQPVPGEAKSTVLIGDELYMAMYSSGELVRYNTDSGETETVASAPEDHNRPRDLHHDPASGRLFMTVQNDTQGGGALVIYDLESEETTTIEPFDSHAVSAVTAEENVAYIAGSVGMQGNEGSAVVSAIDLQTQETLWETTPISGTQAIGALELSNGQIYGMTVDGDFFSIGPENQDTAVSEAGMGPGDLVTHQGGIYGATG